MSDLQEAHVQTTGFQFVKNGLSMEFFADIHKGCVVMKTRAGDIPLSISEMQLLINNMRNIMDIVSLNQSG